MHFAVALMVMVSLGAVGVSSTAPTRSQVASVQVQATVAEGLLTSSVAALSQLIAQSPPDENCSTHYPACGSGSVSLPRSELNSSLPLPLFDFVQTIAASGANVSGDDAELCTASRMRDTWRSNLVSNGTSNIVPAQYYAGQSNNFALYPPSSTWINCSYFPTLKPFYGVSALKDLVIAIDVSANDADAVARVEMAKASALQLLRTLSSRDYVGVLLYSDYALCVTPVLVQATQSTVSRLVESIRNVSVGAAGSGALVAGALRASVTLLRTSAQVGSSSGCTPTVVLLSGGRDDQPFDDPVIVVQSNPDVVVLAVVLLPSAGQPTLTNSTALRRVTCAGVGATAVAVGSAENMTRMIAARSAALIVTSYFAEAQRQSPPAVRWSSSYVDVWDRDAKFSASLPVFRADGGIQGMLVVDVPLSALTLGGNVSTDDVDAILQQRSTCLLSSSLDSAAEATLRGRQCVGMDLSTPSSAPSSVTSGVLVGLFAVLGSIIVVMPAVCECGMCVFRGGTRNGDGPPQGGMWRVLLEAALSILASVAPMLPWAICMAVFWTMVSDDMLRRSAYERVTYTVTRQSVNVYPCCQSQACYCVSNSYPTCSLLVASMQTGRCKNDQKCCPSRCWTKGSCHCNQVFSTCRSVCGACAAPTITVQYATAGHGTQMAWLLGSCGLDDTACRDAWLQQAPLGHEGAGWAGLDNPNDFHLDLPLNVPAVVASGVFGFVAVALSVAGVVNAFRG